MLRQRLAHGDVFFGVYPKPIPYFFPMLDVLEHAIQRKATPPYLARIYVDGIDQTKAELKDLTKKKLRAMSKDLKLIRGIFLRARNKMDTHMVIGTVPVKLLLILLRALRCCVADLFG